MSLACPVSRSGVQAFADGAKRWDRLNLLSRWLAAQFIGLEREVIARRFFWLVDLCCVGVAFLASYAVVPWLRPRLFDVGGPLSSPWFQKLLAPSIWTGQLPPIKECLWMLLTMGPVTLIVLALLGSHGPLLTRSRSRIVGDSLMACAAGSGAMALVLFALKSPRWSRLFVFGFATLTALALASYRLILRRYLLTRRDAGYYARNVLLVGEKAAVNWLVRYFAEHVPPVEYRVLGYLRVPRDACESRATSSGDNQASSKTLASLGRVEDLDGLLINKPIHEVIAVSPSTNGAWLADVIRACDLLGVLLRVVPEALLLENVQTLTAFYPLESLHLPAIVLRPRNYERDSEALFFKRLFDIVVSVVLLVLLAPVFALVALAIKITTPSLPVLYPWHVVGQNGVRFTGYKFTTMYANADALRPQLTKNNEMIGPVFKMRNDPRVTPLGVILRKYSLNELPQLWSVLKGDMSLVGPRPAFPNELRGYEFWQKRKLSIKPGMTCLWQVRGRNRISNFDDWVRMDLEYIDNWSFWLDLKILVWTAWAVVGGTGS